jgi:quercetin dioxygenase-like cupin family protein
MDGITLKNIEEIAPYSGPHAIPGIRFRFAREALGVSSWGMSVIEIDPHCSGYPKHDHGDDGHEEVYFVVRGSVVLQANNSERVISQGDFVRVAPETVRKFITREQGVTLVALGGTPSKPYAPSLGRPAE